MSCHDFSRLPHFRFWKNTILLQAYYRSLECSNRFFFVYATNLYLIINAKFQIILASTKQYSYLEVVNLHFYRHLYTRYNFTSTGKYSVLLPAILFSAHDYMYIAQYKYSYAYIVILLIWKTLWVVLYTHFRTVGHEHRLHSPIRIALIFSLFFQPNRLSVTGKWIILVWPRQTHQMCLSEQVWLVCFSLQQNTATYQLVQDVLHNILDFKLQTERGLSCKKTPHCPVWMRNLTFPVQSPEILAVPFKSNAVLLVLKLGSKSQTWLLNVCYCSKLCSLTKLATRSDSWHH